MVNKIFVAGIKCAVKKNHVRCFCHGDEEEIDDNNNFECPINA